MKDIIDESKELFLKRIKDFGKDPYLLLPHVPEALRWAESLLKKYPDADKEVVRISIWLHDIGHYPITTVDHAITSEKISEEFLKKVNYDPKKLQKVLHCIRAHRCKDIMPETIEAKIMAFSDSASHMTDTIYLDIIKKGDLTNSNEGSLKKSLDKLERDFRDLSWFPENKNEMKKLYLAWKKLLKEYNKVKY